MPGVRILGVDPGTRLAGWGLVEGQGPGVARRLASGVLRFSPRLSLPERLLALQAGLLDIFATWQPELFALEGAFLGRNPRSALSLGEARGVVLVIAASRGIEIVQLSPALVKRRVCGRGNASKEEVAVLVAAQLGMPGAEFASPDESDALAVALCALLERGEGVGAPPASRPSRGRMKGFPPGATLQ